MNRHHQPLRYWGLREFSPETGARILDVGCGGGMTIRDLVDRQDDTRLVGLDLSEDMARFSRLVNRGGPKRAGFLAGDVTNLPFPAEAFDAAVAFETAYFWPDPPAAFAELRRVLRPEGTLLVVNELYRHPNLSREEERLVELLGMDLRTPAGYRKLLEKAGLIPEKPRLHPHHPWMALTARRPPES